VHSSFERKYDIFQRFGRKLHADLLDCGVTRLFLDWRNSVYGKWRSPAAARRSGPRAVALERQIAGTAHSDAVTKR
jgi:hypothetical protein